jgi:lipopolysaccharide/colanic/teichoic acid biosynthesis glycosyltransferase
MSPQQTTGLAPAPAAPTRSAPARQQDRERTRPPLVPKVQTRRSVLGPDVFAAFLERERSLADRGTRRFCLLSVSMPASAAGYEHSRDGLTELARRALARLRSTDIVARQDPERIAILLTDTEPAGAEVVAAWMKQAELDLGLQLEHAIFVYPSVDELPSSSASDAAGSSMEDLWPHFELPTPLWKRSLDVLGSAVALTALLPLFGLTALAIRLDSPGPVIFRQQRAGRGGRPFAFLKFRSMSADAEALRPALAELNEQEGPVFKIRDDPRITRVGRLLRRWSIDELPQLWNVLVGDISLVGPRSATLDEVSKYERWQRRRLSVTGGITCTWQVSGRSEIPFREWMRLDMRYVAARSVWRDVCLLARTLPAVVSGRGAC